MFIRDCMTRETTGMTGATPLRQAVELMVTHHIEALPIFDGDRHLLGCVTVHEFWKRMGPADDKSLYTPVKYVAEGIARSICADESVEAAASILFEHAWLEAPPVLEHGQASRPWHPISVVLLLFIHVSRTGLR